MLFYKIENQYAYREVVDEDILLIGVYTSGDEHIESSDHNTGRRNAEVSDRLTDPLGISKHHRGGYAHLPLAVVNCGLC